MSKIKVAALPHSWRVTDWPATVTPNTTAAGKQIVRSHRAELIACGALTRVGRNLIVLGEGYARFLAGKMSRVPGYEIAPNQEQHRDHPDLMRSSGAE